MVNKSVAIGDDDDDDDDDVISIENADVAVDAPILIPIPKSDCDCYSCL